MDPLSLIFQVWALGIGDILGARAKGQWRKDVEKSEKQAAELLAERREFYRLAAERGAVVLAVLLGAAVVVVVAKAVADA